MAVNSSVLINAPLDDVWTEAIDFGSHVEWMADARSLEFLSEERTGVGTTMAVVTKVGPLQTTDIIEVIEIDPPSRIAVIHRGAVTGRGEFRLEAVGPLKTRFIWEETLEFPWWLGGRLGAALAGPVLGFVWRRNLERLRLRVEGTVP